LQPISLRHPGEGDCREIEFSFERDLFRRSRAPKPARLTRVAEPGRLSGRLNHLPPALGTAGPVDQSAGTAGLRARSGAS